MNPEIDVVRFRELDRDTLDTWITLVEPDGTFASPFFHPGYHALLDAAGVADIEVAIVGGAGGRPSAFWPFQRRDRRRALPAGGRLTDYQGVIGRTDVRAEKMLSAAGLDQWRFDHVPVEDGVFAASAASADKSPRIDLRAGVSWEEQGRFSSKLERSGRRLERELGDLLYVAESTDTGDIEALMGWKSDQYVRTGKIDLFADKSVCELARRLVLTSADGFVGRLSVLRAGERPVAAHLGMVAAGVWHYWIPAYDPDLADCSPGMLLLREMCRTARNESLVVDLGRGEQPYKAKVSNDFRMVSRGTAMRRTAGARGRRAARKSARIVIRRGVQT